MASESPKFCVLKICLVFMASFGFGSCEYCLFTLICFFFSYFETFILLLNLVSNKDKGKIKIVEEPAKYHAMG